MSIQPEGEDLRKAVKWVSTERKFDKDKEVKILVQEACFKFNLSPKDASFLKKFIQNN